MNVTLCFLWQFNLPWLHMIPWKPRLQPFRQVPLMWWHCSSLTHPPHSSSQCLPNVLWPHSIENQTSILKTCTIYLSISKRCIHYNTILFTLNSRFTFYIVWKCVTYVLTIRKSIIHCTYTVVCVTMYYVNLSFNMFNLQYLTQGIPCVQMLPFQPGEHPPLQLPVFLSHLFAILQVKLHVFVQLYP